MLKISKTIHSILLLAIIFAGGLLMANSAYAQSVPSNNKVEIWDESQGMYVLLAGNPIFDVSNFLPGDTEIEKIKVTNNRPEAQTVGLKVDDGFDRGCVDIGGGEFCLADELILTVAEIGGGPAFSGSLTDFYNAGEIAIVDLTESGGSKDSAEFNFSVHFNEAAGEKEYQEATTMFDLKIGFLSKETVSGEGGGSSMGGGSGYISLLLNGVKNIIISGPPILTDTDAVIGCETKNSAGGDILSQCRVIYDKDSHPSLTEGPPNYGYEWSTDPTDPPKDFEHTINLTGLESGETYYYRVVCWASPSKVSTEYVFTTMEESDEEISSDSGGDFGSLTYVGSPVADGQYPSAGVTGQATASEGDTGGTTSEGGEEEDDIYSAGTDPDQTGGDTEEEVEPSGNLASALLAFFGNDIGIGKIFLILLLLLLLFLIARAILKRSKSSNVVSHNTRN
ncbi:MAG: hypothetical protein KAR24_02865 [Candidatus Pacebacteria bacterium]|nr:hypothetical protein [Candidatus Paceibacterota bacterium]